MAELAKKGVRAFRIHPRLSKQPPEKWLEPAGYAKMFAAGAQQQPGDELPDRPRRAARAGPHVQGAIPTRRSSSTTCAASASTARFARRTSKRSARWRSTRG